MSVALRIFEILRYRALSASRAIFDRGAKPRAESPRTGQRQTRNRGTADGTSGETFKDPDLAKYYANLEIPYGSGLEEVKAAWKRLAKRYHPDLYAADPERRAVATELLQGINHAHGEICRHLASSKAP